MRTPRRSPLWIGCTLLAVGLVAAALPAPASQEARATAELAQDYLDRYLAADVPGLSALLAADAVFEDSAMRREGREAISAGLAQVFEGLEIERFEIATRIVAGGARFLFQGRVSFQLDGAAWGRAGQSLRFDTPFAVLLHVRAGRVREHVDLVDDAAFLEQLQAQLAPPGEER